jgi:hypothetical protein
MLLRARKRMFYVEVRQIAALQSAALFPRFFSGFFGMKHIIVKLPILGIAVALAKRVDSWGNRPADSNTLGGSCERGQRHNGLAPNDRAQ